MRFFRKIAGFLGLAKDDVTQVKEDEVNDSPVNNPPKFQKTDLPCRGFGVQVQVPVERPNQGPVLVPCTSGDGGVQGLGWYAKRLKIDEDGDVADEFLDEVLSHTSTNVEEQHRTLPTFEVRYSNRPAKVKNQMLTPDGKIQQCVEYQGRLQWV